MITDKDIDEIISNIKNEGIIEQMQEKSRQYKRLFLLFGLITLIIVGIIYFGYPNNSGLILLVLSIYILYVGFIYTKFSQKWKGKITEVLKRNIEGFNYDIGDTLFPMSVSEYYKESGLLNPYEEIDKTEDSIEINRDGYNLYGMEIKTSKTTVDSKGNRHKETVDHCYIMYGEIKKHRFPIKSKVIISYDLNDSILGKVIGLFSILILGIGLSLLVMIPVGAVLAAYEVDRRIVQAITIIIFIGIITWLLLNRGKNRVKMENTEFEKLFDVHSSNAIEARRLLTPKLQEKLVELAKNSGFKGWGFSFKGNKVFSKFNVLNFLELSVFSKDITQNIKKFLEQVKLIDGFMNYLNIEYFSEVEFLKKREK